MSTLHARIHALSSAFADSIVAAIREVSISELTGGKLHTRGESTEEEVTPQKAKALKSTGRLPRRSDEDIALVVEEIVAVVRKHPEGIRAEELREELGLEKKELPKPMLVALASGAIRKEGEKRATAYFIGGRKAKETPTKKAKAAPKKNLREAEGEVRSQEEGEGCFREAEGEVRSQEEVFEEDRLREAQRRAGCGYHGRCKPSSRGLIRGGRRPE